MSDTVIVLQDECILTASGKAGKLPKIDRVSRIPIEPFVHKRAEDHREFRSGLLSGGGQNRRLRLYLPL